MDLATILFDAYRARSPDCQKSFHEPSTDRRLYLTECHVIQWAPDGWTGDVVACARTLMTLIDNARASAPGTQLEMPL